RERRHRRVRDRVADRTAGPKGVPRMNRKTAAVSAGVVAGALAAGMIGGALVRRRHPRDVEPLGPPPPEDLGPVASFDGTPLAVPEQRPELFGPRIAGVALIGAASSDLLWGAMGSVTELLRPRLGSLQAAARRVDGLRRAVLAGPTGLSGVVARVTQFGPNAP